MMTRVFASCLLSVLPGWQASAQAPSFDVADIKPSTTKDAGPGKERLLPGGRLEVPHATLKELMLGAYGVQPNMIVGGPKWIDTDRFDIIAKAPDPNTPVPTLLLMLRTLLEERFKLVTHREDRLISGYTLSVGKDGPRFQTTTAVGGRQNCSTSAAGSDLHVLRRTCQNMTMAELARQLGLPGFGLDGQVIDQTGLQGAWDFAFDYVRPGPVRPEGASSQAPLSGDAPMSPTIFEAMSKLGLKLESGKRPLPVVVVDKAEKPGEQ